MDRHEADTKHGDLEPVNINEEFVKQCVKKTMEELDVCRCPVCFADACALALNELRPKYVTTKKGALLTGITTTKVSNHTDIMVEATKAILKVAQNPRH
ncbi:late competence development ComFB family protein [Oscillospiraceae bacterium WX1]